MRLLTVAGVLILLVVLPATSWYYLSKGADWRRAGLSEIREKRAVYLPPLTTHDGGSLTSPDLAGKFLIVSRYAGPDATEVLKGLKDQFDHRTDLLLVDISEGRAPDGWIDADCAKSDCQKAAGEVFFGTESDNCALLDNALNVRNTYDLADGEQLRSLIEQSSILFPVEKRKKVELRRGQQQ